MRKNDAAMDRDSVTDYAAAAEATFFTAPAVKRVAEIVVAFLLLVALSPLIAVIVVSLWLKDRRAVIYRHRRVGRNGVIFDCLKFRTMVVDADAALARLLADCPRARLEWQHSRKLRNDPRISGRIGAFLRRTSLDELPQLVNVLRGEMSLVGPRPITLEELDLYGRHKSSYLQVRPGVTGQWQVAGRSDITFADRVAIDVAYVENPSLLRDAFILARTALIPFRRSGAY